MYFDESNNNYNKMVGLQMRNLSDKDLNDEDDVITSVFMNM